MTNKQWLIKEMQNMSDEELAVFLKKRQSICEFIKPCQGIGLGTDSCEMCAKNWLQQEHKEKPKLSDAERVILENVPEEYEWIARDKNKRISIYLIKPAKGEFVWGGGCSQSFDVFTHLFQFIKWEDTEPYNIEELLKCK